MIITLRYNCTIPQIQLIIRLIMWQKFGLAFANVKCNHSYSLGEIAANSVALGEFPINCPLQGKPNLWEFGGSCIMKKILSHVFSHSLRAPPSRVVLLHRDIEQCTCCFRKVKNKSSGVIRWIGLIVHHDEHRGRWPWLSLDLTLNSACIHMQVLLPEALFRAAFKFGRHVFLRSGAKTQNRQYGQS